MLFVKKLTQQSVILSNSCAQSHRMCSQHERCFFVFWCDLSFGTGLSVVLLDVILRDYLICLTGWLAVTLQKWLIWLFLMNDWLIDKLTALLSNSRDWLTYSTAQTAEWQPGRTTYEPGLLNNYTFIEMLRYKLMKKIIFFSCKYKQRVHPKSLIWSFLAGPGKWSGAPSWKTLKYSTFAFSLTVQWLWFTSL